MLKVSTVNFCGERIFCGIDVHKKSWRVNIRSEEFELEAYSQDPDEEQLLLHLRDRYPGGSYEVAYEAGFSGFSLQRRLKQRGVNCMVINPGDVPTSDKDKQRKSDRVDARKISRELSKGSLSGIYVPDEQMEYARSLVRQRRRLVEDQTRCKSRIWHLLMFSGLQLQQDMEHRHWSGRFVQGLQDMDCGNRHLRRTLDLMVEEYLQVRNLLLQATRQVRELSRELPYATRIELLQSIPGIGLVSAMVLLTELQDMRRFSTLDKLCGYAGIVPDLSGSGEQEVVKGITHRSNNYLRTTIVESSWVIIRKDPAMLMAYKKYCKRMHTNKAIIKIARHLLSRIRYVWLQNKPYETGITG
jgi:transposase